MSKAILAGMTVSTLERVQADVRGGAKAYQGAKGDIVTVLAGKRSDDRAFRAMFRRVERVGLVLVPCGEEAQWVHGSLQVYGLYRNDKNGLPSFIDRVDKSGTMNYIDELVSNWEERGKVWGRLER